MQHVASSLQQTFAICIVLHSTSKLAAMLAEIADFFFLLLLYGVIGFTFLAIVGCIIEVFNVSKQAPLQNAAAPPRSTASPSRSDAMMDLC